MKTAYQWFDIFLNLILISPIVAGPLVLYLWINSQNSTTVGLDSLAQMSSNYTEKFAVINTLLIISLIFGLLYISLGIIFIIKNKKNRDAVKGAKKLLIKGIIRSFVAFVFLFIFSLALSFFGLSLGGGGCDGQGGGLCLPKIPDPNTPGFPVNDLEVTNRKLIPPQTAGDSWYCDVTVQNTNATQTAISLTFNNAEEDTQDDSIPPEQSKIIRIYGDTTTITNPCKNVSITAAEILTPDTSPSPSISPRPSQ